MQSLPSKQANKAVLINRNNVNIKTQVTPTTKSKLVYVNELNPSKPQPKIIHKAPILNQNKFKNYDSFKRKPSEKLRNVKLADPFSSTKNHKTNFGYVYSSNGIPCHLQHGTARLFLQWDTDFQNIDYSQVLPVCFEGIMETEHPYKFAARQSCKELLLAEGAENKVVPLLPKLFYSLRIALSSSNDEIFLDTCEITEIVNFFNINYFS